MLLLFGLVSLDDDSLNPLLVDTGVAIEGAGSLSWTRLVFLLDSMETISVASSTVGELSSVSTGTVCSLGSVWKTFLVLDELELFFFSSEVVELSPIEF